MAAVRVPPSAWITSQSSVICCSPSAEVDHRAQRTTDQALDLHRAAALLAGEASRRVRSEVARGSMPYSAVTQPRCLALEPGGQPVFKRGGDQHMGFAEFTKHEPSAYFTTPRSSDTARSSSGAGGSAA